MATAHEALAGLLTEVSTSIKTIEPEETITISAKWKRFTEHNADGTEKPIREVTGVSRLFEFGEIEEVGPYSLPGHAVHYRRFRIPVTFLYYRSTRWSVAAIEDIGQIRHWFMNHQGGSGVDGISCRVFPLQELPVVDRHEEDPWNYYTINLDVHTTITYS